MLPTSFTRLAVDEEIRDAAQHAYTGALTPSPANSLHPRLLRLAARRLQEEITPPRCYYWYGGKPPVRLDGRAI